LIRLKNNCIEGYDRVLDDYQPFLLRLAWHVKRYAKFFSDNIYGYGRLLDDYHRFFENKRDLVRLA
jgi:hypothetical protein